MPSKAAKNWGQADKDLLADLLIKQLINITNTTSQTPIWIALNWK
jgi:hypothetical protein